MDINIVDEDLRLAVMEGLFVKKYKQYRSNKKLQNNLAKAVAYIRVADSYEALTRVRTLACEALTADRQGQYSLRLGYNEKYRLIFEIEDDRLTLLLLEISEHYGDH